MATPEDPETFLLTPLVHAVAEALVVRSPRHRLAIEAEDLRVAGDRRALEQVVAGLVGLALAESPDGGMITIAVGSQAGQACVSVSDEGGGFEPGAGSFPPGLAELVGGLGGTCAAESPGPGLGATFRFTLRLAPAP